MLNSGEKISASDASYFFHRAITGDNKLKVPHGIGNISEVDAVSYIQREVEEKGLDAQRIVDGLRILAKDYKPFEFIYPAGIADGLKTALDGEKVPYAMQARGGAVVVSTRGRYAGRVSEVAGREVVRVLREGKGIEIPENLLPHVLRVVENLARREASIGNMELILKQFLKEINLGGEDMAIPLDVDALRKAADAAKTGYADRRQKLKEGEEDLGRQRVQGALDLYQALEGVPGVPQPEKDEVLGLYVPRAREAVKAYAGQLKGREAEVAQDAEKVQQGLGVIRDFEAFLAQQNAPPEEKKDEKK